MTPTEYKDDEETEPVEAEWTSGTYTVSGAVVGAGGETCTETYNENRPLPQNGTVETCEGSAGGGNETNSQALPLVALAALSLLLRRRQW